MALPDLEKLDTAVVVLSAVKQNVAVSSEELGVFMREPTVSVAQSPGTTDPQAFQITSLRDQVVITISGSKIQFQDQSDSTPGTGKLPDIVQGFLELMRNQGVDRFRAYGINFDVAFDSRGDQTAAEVIADRFLKRDVLSRRGDINVAQAGVRLFFTHGDANCDLKIEPRQGKLESPRFFAHINYNFVLADGTMPPAGELKTKYHGLWPQFTELLENLLVRS